MESEPIKKLAAVQNTEPEIYLNDNKSNLKLQAAIEYAVKSSFKVLPLFHVLDNGCCACGDLSCSSIGKHPHWKLAPNGVHNATGNVDLIIDWWTQEPYANIGIATGATSSIEVIDIDPRNEGNESIRELEASIGPLPKTLEVATGGGGKHFYYRYSGKKLSRKLPGIDFQSDGKYIVAPPSNHASRKLYKWVEVDYKISYLPEIYYSIPAIKNFSTNNSSVSQADLIPEGQRNQSLTSIAGKLRSIGLGVEHIREILKSLNEDKCRPPLPYTEVDRIAESISKYPSGNSPHFKLDKKYFLAKEIDLLINKPAIKSQMNFEALPLPLRKFREWATNSTHAPDEFIVTGFIGAIAAAMGKNIVLDHPLGEIRPHVWIANIANSGEGKTTALNIAGKLLSEIEIPLLEEKRSKLKEYKIKYEKYLKDRKSGKATQEEEPIYPGIRTLTLPSLTSIQKLTEILAKDYAGGIIYVASELSLLLSDWKLDRNAGMIPFYLSLFDSPDIAPIPAYKTSEDLPLIRNPSVSIVGASVERSFFSKFTEEDFVSGNLQRWLIATTTNSKPRVAFPNVKSEEGKLLFKQLLEEIFILSNTRNIKFQFSNEARDYWNETYPILSEQYKEIEESHLISSLIRIDDSYTLKFALISECAKQVYKKQMEGSSMETILTKESIVEAIALADYFKQSLLEVISKLETDNTKKMMKQIISKLRSSENKRMKLNDLKTLCNGFKYSISFDNAIDSLKQLEVLASTFGENNSNNHSLTELIWLLEE